MPHPTYYTLIDRVQQQGRLSTTSQVGWHCSHPEDQVHPTHVRPRLQCTSTSAELAVAILILCVLEHAKSVLVVSRWPAGCFRAQTQHFLFFYSDPLTRTDYWQGRDTDGDNENSVLGDIDDDRRPRHTDQCIVSWCINSEGG